MLERSVTLEVLVVMVVVVLELGIVLYTLLGRSGTMVGVVVIVVMVLVLGIVLYNFVRNIWHNGGVSCYVCGGFGIMYCIIYLTNKL